MPGVGCPLCMSPQAMPLYPRGQALEPAARVPAGAHMDFSFPSCICKEIGSSISECLGLHNGGDDAYCLGNGPLWRWERGLRKVSWIDDCGLSFFLGLRLSSGRKRMVNRGTAAEACGGDPPPGGRSRRRAAQQGQVMWISTLGEGNRGSDLPVSLPLPLCLPLHLLPLPFLDCVSHPWIHLFIQ